MIATASMNSPAAADQTLLATLFRLSTLLASELDPPELAYKIAVAVADAVPHVEVALVWVKGDDERLHCRAVQCDAQLPNAASLGVVRQALDSITLRKDESAVGHALQIGEAVLLEDTLSWYRTTASIAEPARSLLEQAIAQLAPVCAMVCVPLLIGQERIGVLQLINTQGIAPLRLEDVAMFQTFANQTAVILRNAQLYEQLERQNQRLQAFDAVVTAISAAADLRQLLQQALQVMLTVTDMAIGGVALLDGTNDSLVLEVYQNLPPQAVAQLYMLPLANTPYEDVVRFGQPLVQPLHRAHPWTPIFRGLTEGIALMPLLAGGTVVGVLLFGDQLRKLQRLTWSSLMAMGAQIGFAIANAHLYTATSSERRRLLGVITSLAEGVVICNGNGEIELTNEVTHRLLGNLPMRMTLAEFATAFHLRDVNYSDIAPDATPLGRALRGEVFQDYEFLAHASNGRDLVLSASGAPLHTTAGTIDGAVVVLHDITAHKEYDAARDEFLAVAAHELRAPLAAIKGYSELLAKRETQRPDATERDLRGAGMLVRQVDHLILLVDNLLDVSRVDAGRLQLTLQPTDLMPLIEASVERIRAGDGRHVFVVNGPASLIVPLDQLRIQQVLTNLLTNAARYSPAETRITVDVTMREAVFDDGSAVPGVIIAVSDEGPGIPEDAQSRIFQRYFRASTTTATSGLGLGLYVCREIIARHNGRLSFRSTPGAGTTFRVELRLDAE